MRKECQAARVMQKRSSQAERQRCSEGEVTKHLKTQREEMESKVKEDLDKDGRERQHWRGGIEGNVEDSQAIKLVGNGVASGFRTGKMLGNMRGN